MPAKPRKSKPDKPAVIVLRVPGHIKNRMIEHADKHGVPYTNWAVHALVSQMDMDAGVPAPPPAVAPIPSPVEQLHAYLRGERLTLPCGREGVSCAGTERPERVAGYDFCPECHIRVM
jgi:hypothetical protein